MEGASTRVRVRVSPGAGRERIVGRHGEGWKVRVAQRPENGRANDALLKLLSHALAVPRSSVTLVSGHSSRDKIVQLAGLDAVEAETRLAAAGERTLT